MDDMIESEACKMGQSLLGQKRPIFFPTYKSLPVNKVNPTAPALKIISC